MKLEQQVCSLELSKRLKELGVKQESLWWWVINNKKNNLAEVWQQPCRDIFDYTNYSAFTCAELGEMLPIDSCYSIKKDLDEDENGLWECRYTYVTKDSGPKAVLANTEANARASMIVYLLENKLMKLEE